MIDASNNTIYILNLSNILPFGLLRFKRNHIEYFLPLAGMGSVVFYPKIHSPFQLSSCSLELRSCINLEEFLGGRGIT